MNEELQERIDALIGNMTPSSLKKASAILSKTYLEALGSKSIFENEAERLAYLAARMPATFGAVSSALCHLPMAPSSWLDLGAGPGTASWAAASLFPESTRFTLIEKSRHAIEIGKQLAIGHPLLEKGEWISASLPIDLPASDAAILSYSLGELDQKELMIDRWWHASIPLLILVEPGTPRGFKTILKARSQILALGGFLIAPCPHAMSCPLKQGDWCHFSARIARTRLHRYLKGGALGYEDEKYCYLIASKNPFPSRESSRILKAPQKESGHVKLSLCTPLGTCQEKTVGRSVKTLYRQARDASWGDTWVQQ